MRPVKLTGWVTLDGSRVDSSPDRLKASESPEVTAGWAESANGRAATGFARIDRALREEESMLGASAPGYLHSLLATNCLIEHDRVREYGVAA